MTASHWTLRFDIHGWWHVGTGRGIGGHVDAAVERDPETRLPLIPGRTVRGLVREALTEAEELGQVPAGLTAWLCGSPLPETALSKSVADKSAAEAWAGLRRGRFRTRAGAAIFGNAELPEAWRRWAAQAADAADVIDALFDTVASTAIQDDGLVMPAHLRRIEVVAPMTLTADVSLCPEAPPPPTCDDVGTHLSCALSLLRNLGKGRHRGLGRCTTTLKAAPESGHV